jgi:transposase
MASLQKYDSGGRKYWRIVESFRDPKNGRPKIRVVKHIGTVANLLALLEGQERQLEVCSTSHGDVFSLLRVAGQLGVASAIDDALLPRYQAGVPTLGGLTPGQACVLIAIGRACHPTSKMGWADWAQSTSLPELQHLPVNKLTSQFFWEQMDRIPTTVLPVIEEKLATRALELHTDPLDLLLYDATNFFTYIASDNDRCDLAQRGKNKQKRSDLRQIGLALLVSRHGKLPLWHEVYRGNRPDVSVFPDILTSLRKRIAALASDVGDVTVVYDRGNNASKANQAMVDDSDFHYVAALTPANHGKLIEQANGVLEPVQVRPGETVKAWRTRRKVWGAERTCVVFVSERLREGQIRGLHQHLLKRQNQLTKLSQTLLNPRARRRKRDRLDKQIARILSGQRISQVLKVEVEEREPGRYRLTSWIDSDAYTELVDHHFGRRILITDRHDWSTAEIILAYRGQSDVEESFKILKNPFHLALRPQHHWTDQKIEVHAFCCVLAYLLVRLLHTRVAEQTSFGGTTGRLMDLLGKIRRATVLEKVPGRPGRPRVRQVLDRPDDPFLDDIIQALGITP